MSALASASLSFAPMYKSDLDAVVAAELMLYEFPWTRQNFDDSIETGYSAWTMRLSGQLVGYAVLMRVLDEAHLLNISVARDCQGRGYGAALLKHLFDVARHFKASHMLLEVRPSNAPAIALYRKAGFRQLARRPDYYPAKKGREDALLMCVAL